MTSLSWKERVEKAWDKYANTVDPSFIAQKAFLSGAEFGREECKREVLEMLRSKEANRKCIEGTIGIGTFVSHDDWAEWLERRLK